MYVLQLFERGASAFPDAIALGCKGRQLTYRELNLTADRIAHGLKEAGVRNGALVAVFLDRSPEMVAALLGDMEGGRGLHTARSSGSAPANRLYAGGLRSALCAHPQ